MDPTLFKVLHLAAAFALFASLGAIFLQGSGKKGGYMLHGISLIAILLIGFALLKKPPMGQYWWMAKIGLWLFLGAAPTLAKRQVLPVKALLGLSILAGAAAAYIGLAKPF